MSILDSLSLQVSGERMFAHLQEFALREKLSGTPEELQSFRYLKAELDRLGFDTELIMHPAYISLPGAASVEANGDRPSCITHSFSQPSGPDGLTAPVVYIGNGTPAEFAKQDVLGKIVLVDGLANPAVSQRADQAGAVGQIHVSAHEHKHEMCISPVWGTPTHETLSLLPRTVVVTVANKDGERMKKAAAQSKLTATIWAEVDTGWRKIPLLTADMASNSDEEEEPFILFSGHHDTWYFGVMDNGAANATMLEAARILSENRAHWRRGLRLCFWSGHSQGRYAGSAWYAEKHWRELARRCLVHVNADSTGGRGNTVLSDIPASAELRGLAKEVVRTEGGEEPSGLRPSRAGDQSFWGVGIPSLFMTVGEQPAGKAVNPSGAIFSGGGRKGAGFGWWWHTPDDTIDKIDGDILVRDTRIYLHAVYRLLSDPVIPLDYTHYAHDLAALLEQLGDAGAHGIDLALAVTLTGKLEATASLLRERLDALGEEVPTAQVDAALARASRALVPMDYTNGDRFGQDPALGQAAFPSLDPVRLLAKAKVGSDEAGFLAVSAVRAINRLVDSLERGIAELENCAKTHADRTNG